MTISAFIKVLEKLAPISLKEDYDNVGLLVGESNWECSGTMICLDVTEAVIEEAIAKKCNLVIAHHPIIFGGLKKITAHNYVGRTIIKAIKNEVAIYAIHTNLDNVIDGVNGKIADMLGLLSRGVLSPKNQVLQKLAVYVPIASKALLMKALFEAGAGDIGHYAESSFSIEGLGTFKPMPGAQPYLGMVGTRHTEVEVKLEVVFPSWLQQNVLEAMHSAHPYEEVAYELFSLSNEFLEAGSGLLGVLPSPVEEKAFLSEIKKIFNVKAIKHTSFLGKPIQKVAVCGGAGHFLIKSAMAAGADIFITSDLKYHDFFESEGRVLLADIGHYESEQFTIDLLADELRQNFPNFAVLKTNVITNPVHTFFE